MNQVNSELNVLHSVGTFLEISENWIYPQITAVPDTREFIVANHVINQGLFPVAEDRITTSRALWNKPFRGRRWLEPIERRINYRMILHNLIYISWNPQIIHAHFGTQGWKCLPLQRHLGIPLVTSFYGSDAWMLPQSKPCWRARYRELFSDGHLFLVEGPAMRERLCRLGCPPDKVLIQRIGVDTTHLTYERKTFSGKLQIVMLGRFVEKKGLVDGLRACAFARAQGVDLHVTIIGDASPNSSHHEHVKAQLHALAREPALAGCVHFTGFLPIERAFTVIKKHDVFLCPSRHAADGDAEGGSPIILSEAMASGLLCVGTRHCDIPEVILDKKTGILCSEGDVNGMANALCDISGSREDYKSLTEAGRTHIKKNFALNRQLEALREIYDSCLCRNRQPVLQQAKRSTATVKCDLKDEVLAVVVPHYGGISETFIKRYCLDLCPDRTVLVYFYPGACHWQVTGPVYFLPKATLGAVPVWKAFRGLQKMCGIEGLFGDPYTSHSLAAFLRKHQVTCVFSQYLTAGWNVHPVMKRLGIRHVIRGHGFDVSEALENPETCRHYQTLSDADAIVVPSPYQVDRLRRIGLTNQNLISVPYGVDIPEQQPARRTHAGEAGASIQVVAAGRMVAKKSPLSSVKAILAAAESFPEMRFTYIGEGPLEQLARDYVKQHDRRGIIRMVGAKPHGEVLQAMNDADIFLQHSVTDPDTGDQEGAPVAILEAMARGLPVVSTLHSGIPYLVEHGVTGLLTKEGDVPAMSASLLRLARSPELRQSMGLAGRKRAEGLSWQRERETLLKLLFP